MDDDYYDDKNYDYGGDDDDDDYDYGVNGVDISVKLFLFKLLH